MGKTTLDCRAAAALCLQAVTNGSSLSHQLPLLETRVDERDRALFRQLCYGTLRLYPRLMACLDRLLKKPLKNKDRDLQMLLLLGLYQLDELRIPDHAAVGATVAATGGLNKTWARGLVNGVLRNWQRRGGDIAPQLTPAQCAAHPDWLHEALHRDWPQQAEAIEAANNTHPPMCLRVNRRQGTREQYLQTLRENAIGAQPCRYADDGIRLERPVDVERLPGFFQGRASVQDEAAQLSAGLLQLAPGQRVLDACCAPGGKTGHCLEREPGLATLVALDVDSDRLEAVQQNLDRLQLDAQLQAADAAHPDKWWDGVPFDRILLDAPCSATGVIRRHPDIKLHRRAGDIERLAGLQGDLLHSLWRTLAPGGLLLYATCSILPRENEAVVQSFLADRADVQHEAIEADWGDARPAGRQLLPQIDGHDGFYYAVLRKLPLDP